MKHPPTVRHWMHSGCYYCCSWYDRSWYVCLSSSCVLFLQLGWDCQETGIKFPSIDLFSPSWNYKRSPASCISWSPCMALPWLSYCGLLPECWLEELLPSSELQVKLAAQVPPCLLARNPPPLQPSLPHPSVVSTDLHPHLFNPALFPWHDSSLLSLCHPLAVKGDLSFIFAFILWGQPSEKAPWNIPSISWMGHLYFPRVEAGIISTLPMLS